MGAQKKKTQQQKDQKNKLMEMDRGGARWKKITGSVEKKV